MQEPWLAILLQQVTPLQIISGKKAACRKHFKVFGRLKLKELLEAMAGFQKHPQNK
jgi:hypothetical protein